MIDTGVFPPEPSLGSISESLSLFWIEFFKGYLSMSVSEVTQNEVSILYFLWNSKDLFQIGLHPLPSTIPP